MYELITRRWIILTCIEPNKRESKKVTWIFGIGFKVL